MPRDNAGPGKNIKDVQLLFSKAFLDDLNPFCDKVQKRTLVPDIGDDLFGQIVCIFTQRPCLVVRYRIFPSSANAITSAKTIFFIFNLMNNI